jgi:hypothetical protein
VPTSSRISDDPVSVHYEGYEECSTVRGLWTPPWTPESAGPSCGWVDTQLKTSPEDPGRFGSSERDVPETAFLVRTAGLWKTRARSDERCIDGREDMWVLVWAFVLPIASLLVWCGIP